MAALAISVTCSTTSPFHTIRREKQIMRHYCTLFDYKYMPQGLVLYESLKKHSSEPFKLHILTLDDESHNHCQDVINRTDELGPCSCGRMGDIGSECSSCGHLHYLESVGIYTIRAWFPDNDVKELRETRTWQEYCWTLASNWAEYLLIEKQLPEITYLDADCYFFSDPKVIHDEIGDRSIAVIPHRLIPSKRHLEVNGKFNVSWVTFKNNPIGRECLSTWAWQCREKCSATDGCGDQGYVDCWDTKYGHELCVIQNIGAGAAPWNLANWPVTEGPNLGGQPIVFFHAHEFRCNPDGTFFLSGYDLRDEDREFIYRPYVESIQAAQRQIKEALSHTVS